MGYRFLLLFCIALLLPLISYASQESEVKKQEYVVKKGDNLYDLSRKFDVSIDELIKENNLRNNRLDVGDKLLIPNSQAAKKNNKDYTVKSGDTLGEIAERHGVSTKALINENGLKNSKLQIGQLLRIPSSKEPPNTSAELSIEEPPTDTTSGSEHTVSSSNDAAAANLADPVYTVKSGDTLGHIAEKYGVTSGIIKELNGLKNDKLSVGQNLIVPVPLQAKATKNSEENLKAKTPPATYVVQKGDVPGKIAEKLGVSTKELIALNSLNTKSLQIGQVLRVPGTETPVEVAKETTKKVRPDAVQEKKAESPKETKQSIYVVKKGDTPGEIAQKLGIGTKELISINNLNSHNLQIGQKLKVPGAGAKETTAKSTQKADSKTVVSEKSPETPQEYKVKKGDSLYAISKKYNIAVSEIKTKNNLKGDNLRVGQKLTLGSKKPAVADADPKVTPQSGKYTVRKGDTLSQIALKFGVSQKELKSANGLKSNNIRIAQVLKVPGSTQEEALEPKSVETKTAAAPTKEPEQKKAYVKKRYVVKAGDTLSGIANHFKVPVQELKKASALKNDKINKGDVLLIPVPHDYVTIPKQASGSPNYTVVTGDTLGGIAIKFGVSVSELKAANGLRNNELWVGTKLRVPGAGSELTTQAKTQSTNNIKKNHKVKRGDTLGAIAKRYGVSVTELKRANKLTTSTIRTGKSLKIPGTANYMHSYSADSNTPNYNSNGHASNNGHSPNGYHPKSNMSPQYKIISVAKKYLGAPYKFGGNSYKTGIDCSGYVKKVFSSFNVKLPRTARDIYYRSGYKVAKSQLDTGDLVFFQTYAKFPSHVGIYLGDDQFIHASSARKKVSIDNINKRYYRNRYIGAKRVQVSGLFYDEYSKEFEDR